MANHTSPDVNLDPVLPNPRHLWTVLEVGLLRQDSADAVGFCVRPKDYRIFPQKWSWKKGPSCGRGEWALWSRAVHIQGMWESVSGWLAGRLCLGTEYGYVLEGSTWLPESKILCYSSMIFLTLIFSLTLLPSPPAAHIHPNSGSYRAILWFDLRNKNDVQRQSSTSQVMPFENSYSWHDSGKDLPET